jgi:hypothetical protein
MGLTLALARGDSLHAKVVATRPFHLVLGSTVRAIRGSLDFRSQSGGSYKAHPALTFLASKDFLHCSPLPDLAGSESPSLPCAIEPKPSSSALPFALTRNKKLHHSSCGREGAGRPGLRNFPANKGSLLRRKIRMEQASCCGSPPAHRARYQRSVQGQSHR